MVPNCSKFSCINVTQNMLLTLLMRLGLLRVRLRIIQTQTWLVKLGLGKAGELAPVVWQIFLEKTDAHGSAQNSLLWLGSRAVLLATGTFGGIEEL